MATEVIVTLQNKPSDYNTYQNIQNQTIAWIGKVNKGVLLTGIESYLQSQSTTTVAKIKAVVYRLDNGIKLATGSEVLASTDGWPYWTKSVFSTPVYLEPNVDYAIGLEVTNLAYFYHIGGGRYTTVSPAGETWTPKYNTTCVQSIGVMPTAGNGVSALPFRLTYFPNSQPTLTLTNPADNQVLSEGSTFTITGSVSDADGNTIVVKAKLNNGTEQTIYSGTGGNFNVTYNVNQLIAGDNFVTFTADDGQGGIVTKQLKITNTPRPVKPYTLINETNFKVDGYLSIVGAGETESYSPMTKTSYGVKDYIAEDQLLGSVGTPNSQATVKLTLTRANVNMDKRLLGFLGAIE